MFHLPIPVLAVTTLAAALFFYKSLYPRRKGTTPFCQRCNYRIDALTSPRCPECGTTITPKNTLLGERTRHPKRIALALLLLLPSATLLAFTLYQTVLTIEWYPYAPTWWVLHDLQSPLAPTANRAEKELNRRWPTFDPPAREHFLDVCLDNQLKPGPLANGLGDYLTDACDRHLFSLTQRHRYFAQFLGDQKSSVQQSVIRPRAMSGKPVPFGMRPYFTSRAISVSGFTRIVRIRVDGRPATSIEAQNMIWRAEPLNAVGGEFTAPSKLGPHTVDVDVECRLYDKALVVDGEAVREGMIMSFDEPWTKDIPAFSKAFTVHHTFDLVPEDVHLIQDPALTDMVRMKTSVTLTRYHRDGAPYIDASVDTQGLDIPWALDVIAILNGRIYPLGSCVHPAMKTGTSGYSVITHNFPQDTTKATIILRTNADRARETVDSFDTWVGELSFPDVPIKDVP